MNGSAKKIYSLATAIVAVVIAALLLIGSLLPVISINHIGIEKDEGVNYLGEGRYSKYVTMTTADLGVTSYVNFIKYAKYVMFVLSVESLDSEIVAVREERTQAALNGTSDLSSYDNRLSELNTKLSEKMASLTEEEHTKLQELIYDDGFASALSLVCGLGNMLASMFGGFAELNGEYGKNYGALLVDLFGLLLVIVMIVLATIVLPIVALIALISALVRLAGAIKDPSAEKINKLLPKTAGGMCSGGLFCAIILLAFYGRTMNIETGLVIGLVGWVLMSVVRAANKIILEDSFTPGELVKKGLTVISIVCALVMVVSFVNVGIGTSYAMESGDMMESLYTEKYDVALADYLDKNPYDITTEFDNYTDYVNDAPHYVKTQVQEEVTAIMTKNTAIIMSYAAIVAIMAVSVLIIVVPRLGDFTYKNKLGQEKAYRSQYVVSVILVVAMIFANFFTVADNTAKKEAISEGNYKIVADAYKLEGTEEKTAYDSMIAAEEEAGKALDEIKKEYNAATDETEKDTLKKTIIMTERQIELMGTAKQLVETEQKSGILMGIIFSILFMISEFAHRFVPSIADKALGGKGIFAKKEADPAEEAPVVEEAPAEEAPKDAE